MELNCMETPTGLTIELAGNMDVAGCAEIRPKLDVILEIESGGEQVVLDLNRVTYLDSSGVGVIVYLFKRLKENNSSLEIINAHNQPLEFIQLLRIDTAIGVNDVKTTSDVVYELAQEAN